MSSAEPPQRDRTWWVPVVFAVSRSPRLWGTALRQVARLAPRGWWRRPPFLPLPDRDYLRFRLQTMYGGGSPSARSGDVIAYLRWCKREASDRKI
jgi:hypothetical protein